ncbi:hypothetical protein CLV86_1120 [Lacinutrix venerupis]|uniref:Uncharacterized protein n=1 Tax=Lacinutrix venerupis TaxID=1486034 RepID=A0AAC9LLQ2_9FLAO|nr:hypothetical protein [Lacinutrix venerupis]APX99172.1 hypothetical protein BWR22_02225 [Lacinutrix venerupis]RLJ65544.1 hypothetical protein CLV86_1120 [Lacinutrix venerupis]
MHKILKIVVAVLSLIGIISLFRIIAKGEEEVKGLAAAGDTSLLEPMAWIAYIILALTLALVIFFVITNLFGGGSNIKNTLIGVGAFALVLIIGYAVSGGDPLVGEVYAYDGVMATETESRFVGAGLMAFYILSIVAILAMIFSGVKKITK